MAPWSRRWVGNFTKLSRFQRIAMSAVHFTRFVVFCYQSCRSFKGVVRSHPGYVRQVEDLEYRGKTEDISFSKPCSFTTFLSLMWSLI